MIFESLNKREPDDDISLSFFFACWTSVYKMSGCNISMYIMPYLKGIRILLKGKI